MFHANAIAAELVYSILHFGSSFVIDRIQCPDNLVARRQTRAPTRFGGFASIPAHLFQVENCPCQSKGKGGELDGAGDELDSSGGELDGARDELDGAGDELDGAGGELCDAGGELNGAGGELVSIGLENPAGVLEEVS